MRVRWAPLTRKRMPRPCKTSARLVSLEAIRRIESWKPGRRRGNVKRSENPMEKMPRW